jgi:hypothetical protein
MNEENISELFMEENFPRENKALITKGIEWEISNKYQIKKYFLG